MTDTDPKIRAIGDSAERRITEIQQQTVRDFGEIKGLIKDVHAKVDNTMLEVVAIKTKVEGLATKTQLIETIGIVKDYCVAELEKGMDRHNREKHKSLPPRISNGGRVSSKTVAALVAAIAALSGAIIALVEIVR